MNNFVLLENISSFITHFDNGWQSISNSYLTLFYQAKKISKFEHEGKKIIIIGDFWEEHSFKEINDITLNYSYALQKLKGTYYFFVIDDFSVSVFTCFLGLWPIYYSKKDKIVTSDFSLFKKLNINRKVSEKFILESFLFNYAFSTNTLYTDVQQLETHHILTYDSNGEIKSSLFYNCKNLFVGHPKSLKRSSKGLVNIFIETIDKYIPEDNSAISFTGGFDGRTIVSAALYLNKKFDTFSFGRIQNDDVVIPKENSMKLGIKYLHIEPNSTYIQKHYITNSDELTINAGGFNGFLYSHFLYMAKTFSQNYQSLITGYGGSELLRSSHIFGAVTSRSLFYVITIKDRDTLRNKLLEDKSLLLLSKDLINNNIESLLDDILAYKEKMSDLKSLNEQMTYYILENTIKKIFGSWQYSQSKYINIRSPFFDFKLVSEIFRTKFAGVYNDFFTNNPIKRFKGQLLYAQIIEATNSSILEQKTGKGYKPKQLLSFAGKISLVYPFFLKRIKKRAQPVDMDNLALIEGIKHFLNENKAEENHLYFNHEVVTLLFNQLNQFTDERKRDSLLNFCSINILLNHD